ncbi:MAG: UDP binding domain-containing protein, partial [Pseudomonadota bacterium]
TKVVDLVQALQGYGVEVDVHDPLADPENLRKEFGLETVEPRPQAYDAVVLAVPHMPLRQAGLEALMPLFSGAPRILDVKGVLPRRPFILRI